MGKLLNDLNRQLNSEYKKEAEDCLLIYNTLIETTGHVWESDWRPLTSTWFEGKQAIAEARSLNLSEKQIHKAVAYKCSVCHKWHIGKSNKVLTEKDVKKYKHLSLLEK